MYMLPSQLPDELPNYKEDDYGFLSIISAALAIFFAFVSYKEMWHPIPVVLSVVFLLTFIILLFAAAILEGKRLRMEKYQARFRMDHGLNPN